MSTRLQFKCDPGRLHQVYCETTGMNISYTMDRVYWTEHFALRFSEQDMRDLVKWIKSKGKFGRSLLWRHLIGGQTAIAWAEEDLMEARAYWRNRKPKNEGYKLLAAMRPGWKPKAAESESAAQILERTKLAEQLKTWKEENL